MSAARSRHSGLRDTNAAAGGTWSLVLTFLAAGWAVSNAAALRKFEPKPHNAKKWTGTRQTPLCLVLYFVLVDKSHVNLSSAHTAVLWYSRYSQVLEFRTCQPTVGASGAAVVSGRVGRGGLAARLPRGSMDGGAGGKGAARWMQRSMHLIGHLPITEISLPGSHDSCTSALTDEVSVDHGSVQITELRKAYGRRIVDPIVRDWSRNQPLAVREQLDSGVRYLDVRIGNDASKQSLAEGIRCCHGLWGISFARMLQDIADFVRENSAEFVILDCNHFYHVTREGHKHILESIQSALGPTLVPRHRWMLPLSDLASQSQRVFVVYHWEGLRDFGSDWALEGGSVDSTWPDAKDLDSLKQRLDGILAQRKIGHEDGSPGRIFVLQGILTEGRGEVMRGIISNAASCMCACAPFLPRFAYAPSSIQEMSAVVNPRVCKWVSEEYAAKGRMNVVLLDWVSRWEDVEWIVALNHCQQAPGETTPS